MNIFESIRDAKKDIRVLKKSSPHIFLEYQELQNAKSALKDATARLRRAEQTWKRLGN